MKKKIENQFKSGDVWEIREIPEVDWNNCNYSDKKNDEYYYACSSCAYINDNNNTSTLMSRENKILAQK